MMEGVTYAWPRSAAPPPAPPRRAQPMRNRARQSTSPIERLRLAIDCLPERTREAMLEGVLSNERIIAGAYVDELGGVCPMLAAHRRGGRTDFLSFAKSWDRFTRAPGGARAATKRERAILVAQLEDSLARETGSDLDAAIAEHRRLRSARMRAEQRRGRERKRGTQFDPDGEIRVRRIPRLSLRRRSATAPRLAART